MKLLSISTLLLGAIAWMPGFALPAASQQVCTGTIPAGAITNGELLNLMDVEAENDATGGDPALMAFGRATNDIGSAAAFYNRVGDTPAVQEDETLQIMNERVFFGEALACRDQSCHIVFIRPLSQIAHHWLKTIQRDFEQFDSLSSKMSKGANFISDLKNASDNEQGSVWRNLSKLYCNLDSNGKYIDLNGSVVLCHNSNINPLYNLLLPKGASTSPRHKGKS